MQSRKLGLLTIAGAAAAGTAAIAGVAYRKDINAARKRIETGRQFIATPDGPIEFAESGNGPAAFVVHGAGGGFDQGLDLGRAFLGDGFRVIAPSRFGYLGTPLPADTSAEAQADAHLRVLDALKIETTLVIGVSAGGPSAMQLCLRHPDRCSALVLIVPLAYAPNRGAVRPQGRPFAALINTVMASDFLFWIGMKVAHDAMVKTILGTPVENYRNATDEQRQEVDQMLRSILPVSKRAAGIANETVIASTLTRYALEEIRVPTLLIGAADCLYETYEGCLYMAEEIPHAKLIAFSTGGHLLVGHVDEVRRQITSFVKETLEAAAKTAVAS